MGKGLSANACALLIESRAASQSLLHEQLQQVMASIADFPLEQRVDFSEDPAVYNQLWKIRKDTFPPSAPCARPAPPSSSKT